MSYCWHCFREFETPGPCPFCGYDPEGQRDKYPLALPPGSILNGRYAVGRVLGQGGFGITYIARDYKTGGRVAIKEYLPTEFAGREANGVGVRVYAGERKEHFAFGKEQFLAEAKTLAQYIGDENIVQIHSYFEENATAYYEMEYVDGPSLKTHVAQKGGRLAPEEAGALLLPLMGFLCRLHANGLIHRDIAPDNIILESETHAKLIDFGAARYSTGEKSKSLDIIIKQGFAPYEQYMHRGRQGAWTDVYAMAATFYFAITGQTPPESVERREHDALIPPAKLGVSISKDTWTVLSRAMAILPQDRYPSMTEFYSDLQAALAGAPIRYAKAAPPPAAPKREKEKPRASRLPLILAAVAAVTAIAVGAMFFMQRKSPAVTAPPAAEEPAPAEILAAEEESAPAETAEIAAPTAEDEPNLYAEALAHYGGTLSAAKVGDTLVFGSFEQDNDTADGAEPIEWQVLDKEGDRLLLISRYALDCRPFGGSSSADTWERSSLRAWLNSDFYNAAFSPEEQLLIPLRTVSESANARFGKRYDVSTNDLCFVLSIEETEKYFQSKTEMACLATAYAKARGCYINSDTDACIWWLRAPGSYDWYASYVDFGGSVTYSGDDITNGKYAVRPAMWVQFGEPAASALNPASEVKVLSDAEVGDVVLCGSFEQDGDLSNGREAIEWLVLAKRDERLLVISRSALFRQAFDAQGRRTNWGECSLREWLNGEFLNTSFSAEELERIPLSLVSADKNPDYPYSAGNTTKDRVFLLSIQELGKYLPSPADAQSAPTPRAAAQGGNLGDDGACWWWLRSTGRTTGFAAYVFSDGSVCSDGVSETDGGGMVRPAMWLDVQPKQ